LATRDPPIREGGWGFLPPTTFNVYTFPAKLAFHSKFVWSLKKQLVVGQGTWRPSGVLKRINVKKESMLVEMTHAQECFIVHSKFLKLRSWSHVFQAFAFSISCLPCLWIAQSSWASHKSLNQTVRKPIAYSSVVWNFWESYQTWWQLSGVVGKRGTKYLTYLSGVRLRSRYKV